MIAKGASSEKYRTYNLYIYTALGLVGYGVALFYLWENLDAGPVRFVYGASVVLTIVAVAIALLHYFTVNPLTYRPPDIQEQPEPLPVNPEDHASENG